MSALAPSHPAPAPASQRPSPRKRQSRRLFEPGRLSLESRIVGLWEELRNAGRVDCPLCDGELVAGEGCSGCGAELG